MRFVSFVFTDEVKVMRKVKIDKKHEKSAGFFDNENSPIKMRL